MSFSNPNSGSTTTGTATGDKFSKTSSGPNFGQRLGQYMGQHNPLMGALYGQVFGQPQAPIQHDTSIVQAPDQSQPQPMADMAQPAKGLNLSGIAKLIMGVA